MDVVHVATASAPMNAVFLVLLIALAVLAGLGCVLLCLLLRRTGRLRHLDSLAQSFSTLSGVSAGQLQSLESLQKLVLEQNRENRSELQEGLNRYQLTMLNELKNLTANMEARLGQMETKTGLLTEQVNAKLEHIRTDNEQRLEQMRKTVDERLQSTLEQRLGESFKLVSDQLEVVHRSLGEMQNLAAGVGDLKRVLTNIKSRGNWGEVQVDMLLEDILTPDQYEKNVATKSGSNDRVEFAIKLPGREVGDPSAHSVWLPIDAKFPKEDYERLLDAQDKADGAAAELAVEAIRKRIMSEAKDICAKYIDPPQTTDFAIMFLPVEGLFAEVLRIPGLVDLLQRQYRVVVSGPTTLSAMLNSLQMGFRTLAIEKRSSEVWKILGAVKTEFGRFGDVLDKTRAKLSQAAGTLEDASVRTRAIERKLRSVEVLPSDEAARTLGQLPGVSFAESDTVSDTSPEFSSE